MLPFSKRTTTAVTVFACLFAARNAMQLTTDAGTINILHLQHAELFHVYRKVLHQDVANQASVLDGIIAQAVVVIGQLNTTVQAMPQPNPLPENAFALTEIQQLVFNATIVMANVTVAE